MCGNVKIFIVRMQSRTSSEGTGDVSKYRWHIGHLQHVATSVGEPSRRPLHSTPSLVVVRHYKLHSRCSGRHLLLVGVGRHPSALAPMHNDDGKHHSMWSRRLLQRKYNSTLPIHIGVDPWVDRGQEQYREHVLCCVPHTFGVDISVFAVSCRQTQRFYVAN